MSAEITFAKIKIHDKTLLEKAIAQLNHTEKTQKTTIVWNNTKTHAVIRQTKAKQNSEIHLTKVKGKNQYTLSGDGDFSSNKTLAKAIEGYHVLASLTQILASENLTDIRWRMSKNYAIEIDACEQQSLTMAE
jgi:hypothetical protein